LKILCWLKFLSFLCLLLVQNESIAQTVDPNQIAFEKSLFHLNQQEYSEAINGFEELYLKTKAPRVMLEWARACYLSGDLKRAKELFQEVLGENPPMMVRERIGFFLEEISLSEGKIEASSGVVVDTNPRAVTNNRILNIFGQSFAYNPTFDTSPQFGIGYGLLGAKAFGDEKRFLVGFNINGAKFEDYFFDRTNLEEYATYRIFDNSNLKIKGSYEQFFYGGNLLYTAPGISLLNSKNFPNGAYWTNTIKFSNLDYPDYSYLSGPLNSFITSYGYPIIKNGTLGFELGIDRANANENPYSYWNQSIGLVGNLYLTNLYLKFQAKAVAANRTFDDLDPLFGIVRQDKKRGIYFSLIKTDWKIYGVAPSLDIGYEINDSNIDLYTYSRNIMALNLKKVY